jgi:D-beta-D-heptose 7-phosphate kinase/D-beta-D-heptose 1-phosphate adenosyltransferase
VLSSALAAIRPKSILVVGDLILDCYTFGQSKRISPEAPVPVVLIDREEARIGGAGNVALNLASMGMRPRIVGRVGDDPAGQQLMSLLSAEGVDCSGLFVDERCMTPVKTRVIASQQQLMRIDREQHRPLSAACEQMMIQKLPELFAGVDLVAISDYAKGTLSAALLRSIIGMARTQGVPCITDPKGTDFHRYAGSTILKPNASETLSAAPPHATSSLEEAARTILQNLAIDVLMVTRSEEGISLFYPDGRHQHFPVLPREVRDVTGAGDTVLAMLSAAYASGIALDEAVRLSNAAASCAVERLGCVRISLQDVASTLIRQNPSGKVCSAEAFYSLVGTLGRAPMMMIRMPPSHTISSAQLMRLAEVAALHSDKQAIAYFEEQSPDPRLLDLVAGLRPLALVVHGLDVRHEALSRLERPLLMDL